MFPALSRRVAAVEEAAAAAVEVAEEPRAVETAGLEAVAEELAAQKEIVRFVMATCGKGACLRALRHIRWRLLLLCARGRYV